jgi:hypothetical protein
MTGLTRATRHEVRWLAIPGAMLAVAIVAGLITGQGDGRSRAADAGSHQRARVTTTAAGTVIARQVDRPRGLQFEVESAPIAQYNTLSVGLTVDAPTRTRDAVLHHLLAGSCVVPHEPMLTFFGRWDAHARRFRVELGLDDPRVVVADRATTCSMWVGRRGSTPDVGRFPKRPFSHVRLR